MKQIPYGIDDFERIIRDDYYYIDKSRYIQTIEDQGSYIVFVRPRRMGKSMFTNMMMSYYDLANKDRFDELFGNLWIGKHPTKWANQFVVLKFDFSQIGYDNNELVEQFNKYCLSRLKLLFYRYPNIFSEQERDSVIAHNSRKFSKYLTLYTKR